MQYLFSQNKKFRTWRKLWIALAETEKELGLNITQEQIDEMRAHQDDINYEDAREREKLVRHDVMSHVYAYGLQCPKAKGIIHLGATSAYVGDNTDIIIMRDALTLVRRKVVNVIARLAAFAREYKDLPTLAFTHFQPAQPTTVGKRATLWIHEFMMDLEDIEYVLGSLKLLGSKGTTGTQASFLELFDQDQEKVDRIDPMIAQKMGFAACYPVSGQTYSRKVDARVLNVDVTFSNVIVQSIDMYWEGGSRPDPELTGTGNADYFMGGKHYAGVWERKDYNERTVFYGEDGNEIKLQPGKTLIIQMPVREAWGRTKLQPNPDRSVTYE